jgi:GT2 family glycosyltransferase
MKKSQFPLVTFVILGWNNKDLLPECFSSIKAQTYQNLSIVYVDNGSKDGSLQLVRKKYPEIITVDVGNNEGFSIGNNIGIRKALENKDCRYVALVNTDATLAEDWTTTLVDFALAHPHTGGLQTPTYDYYDHSVLDSRGIIVDHYGRNMQLGYRSNPDDLETKIVFGVNAAAGLFSRDFLDAQPFGDEYLDSDLWMYLEDVDLAARATVMGWSNWFVNKSAAYHMGSASSSKNPGFSVYQIYRNSFPMLYKNLPASILIRILPGLCITDLKTILDLLRGRNKIALKALLRGRLKGFALLPKMRRKRASLRKESTISNRDLWQLMQD